MMYLQKVLIGKKIFFLLFWRSPTKRAGYRPGSGSVSQRYGSPDPDPYQMPPNRNTAKSNAENPNLSVAIILKACLSCTSDCARWCASTATARSTGRAWSRRCTTCQTRTGCALCARPTWWRGSTTVPALIWEPGVSSPLGWIARWAGLSHAVYKIPVVISVHKKWL